MSQIGCPLNVTSITVNGVAKVPDAKNEITVTQAEATTLAPIQAQAYLVGTVLAGGAVTLNLPSIVTSITINGNVYNVDGSGNISGVPAADATIFLRRLKGHPLRYHGP